MALQLLQVGVHHSRDEVLEAQLWGPAELAECAGRVTDVQRRLGSAHERRIDADVALGLSSTQPNATSANCRTVCPTPLAST